MTRSKVEGFLLSLVVSGAIRVNLSSIWLTFGEQITAGRYFFKSDLLEGWKRTRYISPNLYIFLFL